MGWSEIWSSCPQPYRCTDRATPASKEGIYRDVTIAGEHMKENETFLVNGRDYLFHIHLAGKRVRGIGRTEIACAYGDLVYFF